MRTCWPSNAFTQLPHQRYLVDLLALWRIEVRILAQAAYPVPVFIWNNVECSAACPKVLKHLEFHR
eukprot:2858729-Rhodomonas_salina.1